MNAFLLTLCLCGAPPEAPPGMVQLTWQFQGVAMPGYSVEQLKARFRDAGAAWERTAAVRFKEAPPGPRYYTFRVVTRNKAGVWGTYSQGTMTLSTWKPNVRDYMAMTPTRRDQHFNSLVWHEMWHALGGRGNTTPAAMRAWAVARYGPPLKKTVVPADEIQSPPPAPRWRGRRPLRRLILGTKEVGHGLYRHLHRGD